MERRQEVLEVSGWQLPARVERHCATMGSQPALQKPSQIISLLGCELFQGEVGEGVKGEGRRVEVVDGRWKQASREVLPGRKPHSPSNFSNTFTAARREREAGMPRGEGWGR